MGLVDGSRARLRHWTCLENLGTARWKPHPADMREISGVSPLSRIDTRFQRRSHSSSSSRRVRPIPSSRASPRGPWGSRRSCPTRQWSCHHPTRLRGPEPGWVARRKLISSTAVTKPSGVSKPTVRSRTQERTSGRPICRMRAQVFEHARVEAGGDGGWPLTASRSDVIPVPPALGPASGPASRSRRRE